MEGVLFMKSWMFNGLYHSLLYHFGTNLLTQRPSPDCCFCLFQGFAEKEYQTEYKRNETFARDIFGGNHARETSGPSQGTEGLASRVGGAPPASRLARVAPGAPLLPIYTYVPQKLHTKRENPNSTAVASVPVEIPSWSLFREGDPSRRPSSSSSSSPSP